MTLDLLAHRLGIATSYTSAWREQITVPDATIVAIIASMGFATTGPRWMAELAADLDAATHPDALPPVLVAWDGRAPDALVSTSGLTLTHEDGSDLTDVVRRGGPLPFGYHHVTTSAADAGATALLISAPRHLAPQTERRLCVFAPLYALRPADPTRYADLRELHELTEWVADHGANGVLTLPLLAGFLDSPLERSPYAPASRVMWNELYAVVDRDPLDATGPTMDYAAAYEVTVRGIDAHARGLDHDPVQAAAFLQFLAAHPAVGEYARFRAAGARHGRDWHRWPEHLRHGVVPATEVDPVVVRRHCVGQWLVHQQLTEVVARAATRDVVIGLDLAVGTHALSFDVWARQDLFATGASVGAPPDAFFPGGQNWGFPPPIPWRARADGYTQLRAALRHHLQVARLLRVDHIMGLLRLYWVPDGAAATDGTYVGSSLDEQLAVVCLEAHRAGAAIIGENLGLVPPEIDLALTTHGLLGMSVAFGAIEDPDRSADPLAAPASDLATFGTHDMPTFAGFVAGDDLTDRIELGFGAPEDARAQAARRATALAGAAAARGVEATAPALFDALSVELAATDAPWVVVALDDLLDERAPHNVPGTSDERPNWRKRAHTTLAGAPPAAVARLRRVGARAPLQTGAAVHPGRSASADTSGSAE